MIDQRVNKARAIYASGAIIYVSPSSRGIRRSYVREDRTNFKMKCISEWFLLIELWIWAIL